MALMQTILVVDDEPQIVKLVRDYLEHGGFNVLAAADGPAALRTAATQRADLIRAGDVELNVPSMQLTIAGRRVELTPTEFQLLTTMARQPGRVFSRAQLLSAVRGSRSSRTSAPSTPTSRTCAARWSRIRT